MIEISKHIRNILLEKGKLVLPGLGSFDSAHVSALFDQSTGTYHAPYKAYSFICEKEATDEALEREIAEKEGLSRDEAAREVSDFISDCWYVLNKGRRLQFMEVGVLFKDEQGNVLFEPDELLTRGGEFFGLSDIAVELPDKTSARPAGRPVAKAPGTTKTKARISPFKVILLFILLGLLSAAVYFFKDITGHLRFRDQRGTPADTAASSMPSLTGDSVFIDTLEAQVPDSLKDTPTLADTDVPGTMVQPAPEPPPAKAGLKMYYIVAGCFRSAEGAQTMAGQLKAKGYPSAVFGRTASGLNMVSYGSFATRAEAHEKLKEIRAEGDNSAYIIRY